MFSNSFAKQLQQLITHQGVIPNQPCNSIIHTICPTSKTITIATVDNPPGVCYRRPTLGHYISHHLFQKLKTDAPKVRFDKCNAIKSTLICRTAFIMTLQLHRVLHRQLPLVHYIQFRPAVPKQVQIVGYSNAMELNQQLMEHQLHVLAD